MQKIETSIEFLQDSMRERINEIASRTSELHNMQQFMNDTVDKINNIIKDYVNRESVTNYVESTNNQLIEHFRERISELDSTISLVDAKQQQQVEVYNEEMARLRELIPARFQAPGASDLTTLTSTVTKSKDYMIEEYINENIKWFCDVAPSVFTPDNLLLGVKMNGIKHRLDEEDIVTVNHLTLFMIGMQATVMIKADEQTTSELQILKKRYQ
jgi:hypothetical protein